MPGLFRERQAGQHTAEVAANLLKAVRILRPPLDRAVEGQSASPTELAALRERLDRLEKSNMLLLKAARISTMVLRCFFFSLALGFLAFP